MRQVLLFVLLFTLVVADELKDKRTLDANSSVAERRLKRFKYLPFGLLGFGGLQALSWFVAIKFKLIVIFFFIVGALILGAKVLTGKSLLGGGCGSSGIEHITPYHSSESVEYSSYPGGSGESTYLDHPPTGYSSSGGSYSSGSPTYGSPYSAGGQSEITADEPYPASQKRNLKTRSIDDSENGRAENDDEDEEIDLADITFAVLGVQKRACKKRFVCEFDFRSQLNPFFRIAYKFIRNGMFPKYDTLTQLDVKHFGDCRKLFPTCMTPNEMEEQTNESEATTAAAATTANDDEDVDSGAEAESNELTEENETVTSKQNPEKIGRLILRRMGTLSRFF